MISSITNNYGMIYGIDAENYLNKNKYFGLIKHSQDNEKSINKFKISIKMQDGD